MYQQNFVHVLSRDGRVIAVPVVHRMNGINLQRMFCQFTAREILQNVRESFIPATSYTPRDK